MDFFLSLRSNLTLFFMILYLKAVLKIHTSLKTMHFCDFILILEYKYKVI